MRYRPKVRFALPGLIALLVLLQVRDFLPEWLRGYATVSVVATLIIGLVTGQVAELSHGRADQPVKPVDVAQPAQRRPEYTSASMILTLVGVALAAIAAAAFWLRGDQERNLSSLFGTVLVTGLLGAPFEIGAILAGLRTRHTKWGRIGLGIAVTATGLLILAWTGFAVAVGVSIALEG